MENNKIKELFKNWNFEINFLGYEKMFKASVLVPLVIINGELNILFQVRAKHIKQGGEVSFPGGKVDKEDKDFACTALRETHEELGLSLDKIHVKGQLDTLLTPFNSIIGAYIGFLDINSLDDLDINKAEVEKVFLVPLKWFYENKPSVYSIHLESHPSIKDADGNIVETFPAKKLGLPEVYHKSWMTSSREILLYEYKGEKIWGFTALFLQNALDKLEELGVEEFFK